MAVTQPVCRFDHAEHRYYIDDVEVPHVTEMLADAGLIDDSWYSDESAERGQAIHDFAARYDQGAIRDPRAEARESRYGGWFAAHVDAMRALRPTWSHVEIAFISPVYRFGGRPDRVGRLWGAWTVVDLKTGVSSRATPIQLALQCLLVAPECHLPPEAILRHELSLKENGRWALIEHKGTRDIQTAYDVIQQCCRRG